MNENEINLPGEIYELFDTISYGKVIRKSIVLIVGNIKF